MRRVAWGRARLELHNQRIVAPGLSKTEAAEMLLALWDADQDSIGVTIKRDGSAVVEVVILEDNPLCEREQNLQAKALRAQTAILRKRQPSSR